MKTYLTVTLQGLEAQQSDLVVVGERGTHHQYKRPDNKRKNADNLQRKI